MGNAVKIVRNDNGRTHWYTDVDTGERVPGVTTILDQGLPKKALIKWAANATADYAIDHWDELAEMAPSARLKALQGGRYAVKDEAARRGTQVHKMGERLIAGESVTVPDLLRPYVDSYVRFLDEFQLRARYVEGVVYSETHRYVGTFDILGDIVLPDMPEYDHLERDEDGYVRDVLIDAKTNRSGIFGETALQLAAYRNAEFLQPDPRDPDTAIEMPPVAWTAALWIRPDDYELIPVTAGDEQHRVFLYAQQVGAWDSSSRDLIGEPIEPPTASRYVLTKLDEEAAL
ncbi:MAG: hypothetical protein IRZ07_20090 [Microbispora sp.]|nr:hypothetical protein [Microbispora sp.]